MANLLRWSASTNLRRQAREGNSIIRCAHGQSWNQELKKSVQRNLYHKNVSEVFDEEVEAENEIGDGISRGVWRFWKIERRCYWKAPTKVSIWQRWSEEDPIENEWIYSKNTKIVHTNFVIPVERKNFKIIFAFFDNYFQWWNLICNVALNSMLIF